MYKNILIETAQGAGKVILNRPEVYNSLNEEICLELIDAFKKFSEDNIIKVIILTGAGKGFCSGQDLKVLNETEKIKPSEIMGRTYNPLITAMRDLPKPIICRMNGVAAGAGCSLALACDMIVATEQAVLTEAFVGIGLVPDSGSSYFLPRMVGSLKAFELAAMGSKLTATEALKLGLVNKVVPEEELDAAVSEIASYFLHAPSKTIALIKQLLNKSSVNSLEEMLKLEAQYQDIAAATEDFREGVKAFREKRKPTYKGQ